MQGERGWGKRVGGGRGVDAEVFRRTYEAAAASRPGFASASGVLCLAGAHRWCPQRYMGRAKRALIKGFDQKKTHHLPSSPPFCTQWISRAKNDAGQVSDKNRRFAAKQPWRAGKGGEGWGGSGGQGAQGVGFKLCCRWT